MPENVPGSPSRRRSYLRIVAIAGLTPSVASVSAVRRSHNRSVIDGRRSNVFQMRAGIVGRRFWTHIISATELAVSGMAKLVKLSVKPSGESTEESAIS
jgi:hypothetical protein